MARGRLRRLGGQRLKSSSFAAGRLGERTIAAVGSSEVEVVAGWFKSTSEERRLAQLRLSEAWDILAVLLLLPVVVLMGSQLPGDWKHHNGGGVPGNAVVSVVEPTRGGSRILVDVSDELGRVVATQHEVNGDAPHVLGAEFAVTYLSSGDMGVSQVYTAGHDPFTTNLLVFLPCAGLLLAGLVRVGVRLRKLSSRWLARNRTGPYRAGYGYTRK